MTVSEISKYILQQFPNSLVMNLWVHSKDGMRQRYLHVEYIAYDDISRDHKEECKVDHYWKQYKIDIHL